jgi:hypothetical protein
VYSATPILRSVGLNSLIPGIVIVVIASLLLSWWELRRLTGAKNMAVDRWLPTAALAAAAVSFVLIAVRFIGVA